MLYIKKIELYNDLGDECFHCRFRNAVRLSGFGVQVQADKGTGRSSRRVLVNFSVLARENASKVGDHGGREDRRLDVASDAFYTYSESQKRSDIHKVYSNPKYHHHLYLAFSVH
jgi:hypothetical protein